MFLGSVKWLKNDKVFRGRCRIVEALFCRVCYREAGVLFRLKNNGEHPFDCRRMQPGVTVALATVWLAGATGVLSATLYPLYPYLDQYSPQLPPNHHEVTQGPQGHANWNFQDPSEDLLTRKIDQTSNVYQPIESNSPPPRPFQHNGTINFLTDQLKMFLIIGNFIFHDSFPLGTIHIPRRQFRGKEEYGKIPRMSTRGARGVGLEST